MSIAAASATFKMDLIATGMDGALGQISNGGKTIALNNGATGSFTLQLWAEVQNASPTTGVYGVQSATGSIISQTTSGTLAGILQPALFVSPFDQASQTGVSAELSSPADSLVDRGGSSLTITNNYIRFRKDPSAGGTQVGATYFATNTDPAGATFQAIPDGFEFLVGSVTVMVTSVSSPEASLNWAIPNFLAAALKGTRAIWTEGDGVSREGNSSAGLLAVGSPVTIVPEPSVLAILTLTCLGLTTRRCRARTARR